MIPRPLTTFIGRQPESRLLRDSVRGHPLTTVVGPPGVGKTRLAVETVRDLAAEFGDRCWFVDLAPVGAPELVAPTVLAAIGAPSREADVLTDLARAIPAEPALLLIDNCEHVASTVAGLAVALLGRCPRLSVLATSRSELGVAGERVVGVQPFDTAPSGGRPSEAVELFYERADARGAGLGRDDATLELIARICARLDGLPLAIELAAARARVLSLATLDELVVEPLGVLTSAPPQSALPQRSLQASIAWSHRLCSADEQRAWEALAVFAGSFSLPAARAVLAVVDTELSAVDVLDALVARSLLQTVADTRGGLRYRMLETLRAFARGRLETRAADAARVRRAHAAWYAAIGDDLEVSWVGPGQSEKLADAERDLANIREAAGYAIAASEAQLVRGLVLRPAAELWWAGGRLEEGMYWLRRTLAMPGLGGEVLIRALVLAATFGYGLRLLGEGDDHLDRLTELCRTTDDPYTHGARAYAAGFGQIQHGDPAAAVRTLHGGLRIADADPAFIRMSLRTRQLLAYAYNMLGDEASAAQTCDQIVGYAEPTGEAYFLAFAHQMYAFYAWRRDDRHAARVHARTALDVCLGFPRRPENADLLAVCALIEDRWGDPRRAAILLAAARAADRIDLRPTTTTARDAAEAVAAITQRPADPVTHSIGAAMGIDEALAFARGKAGRPGGAERVVFTPRETEIRHMIRLGMANKQMARALGLSPKTVEGHIARLMVKLGVNSRVQIATWTATDG